MAQLDWYIRANLKPRHLQLLAALDDLRNVGRVASLLNVSQPAVSKSLAEIERGVGLTLFDRGPRGLTPTAYGECMIRMCRAMLRNLEVTAEELRTLRSGSGGRVRVGVLPVAAPVLVPRAVILLQQEAPHATAVLHEATADRLLPMLRDGSLDLVVGTLPPMSMCVGLEVQVLHPGEGVAVVCGRHHPLAARQRVSAPDLSGYPLVIPPMGTIYRDAVDQAMDLLSLSTAAVLMESGSMTSSNTYLRETPALSFYSPHLAKHYKNLGWLQILPLQVPTVRVPLGCMWSRGSEVSAATQLMIEMLQRIAEKELALDKPAPSRRR